VGDELSKSGKKDQSLARYREALQFLPGDAQLHGKTGMALAELARLDEAQAEFETSLRIDPQSEPARQAMDVIRAMKKRQ